MSSKILDYVDFEAINNLLEGFNKLTGFVVAIVDLDGNVLSQSGWRDICTQFHRKYDITSQNCTLSDIELTKAISKDEKYRYYKCLNGLIDVAVPIIINDEHIANLFTGQFFLKEPDISFFKDQATRYGFDEKPYIEALSKVPVYTIERIESVMEILLYITQIIIKMTNDQLYQIEINKAIMKNEEILKAHDTRYRTIIETTQDGFWVVDINSGKITDVNETYSRLTGYSNDELIGMHISNLDVSETPEETKAHIDYLLINKSDYFETQHKKKDGYIMDIEISATYIEEEASIVAFCRDITERKNAERELCYLSYHDHLTGLYNRRFFEEELKRIDSGKKLPISIIMCDVNGLKLVNDSFGHDAGDELLKKTTAVIKKACGQNTIIARIGGDEFIVLLPNTGVRESTKIAKNIKELASNEKVENIELSISYGYDTKTRTTQSMVDVIANAENHMYKQKLYERSSLRSKTIDLIMSALFEKSNRELLHSKRVSAIGKAIADKMNLDKEMINKIGIAGLIHDIGKIGIDEKILNKDGWLDPDERETIEKHPEIGWRLLSATNEFAELSKLVLTHHEKWDGSGYPNGLKSNAIPLEARILMVADAYDAMTNERSYRKALSVEEAVQELKICSGTHFDPTVVNVFIYQVLTEQVY